MTSSARPNLGGLFNGSTPAQRPSRIADPAAPRLVSTPAVPGRTEPAPPVPAAEPWSGPAAEPRSGPAAEPRSGPAGKPAFGPADQRSRSERDGAAVPTAMPDWGDPVTLVNQYFQFLRTLLDVNQQFAVACATAMVALPRRVGLRR